MLLLFTITLSLTGMSAARTITDALGRQVEIPDTVEHLVCSGSGCIRLLTYLQAQEMLVGADECETRKRVFDARPYAFANPWLRDLPMTGLQGGREHPEAILMLEPQPQVILRTYPASGNDPVEMQQKTGIPVVTLEYGGLLPETRADLYQTLRTMGEVTGKESRAEEVIDFFEAQLQILEDRIANTDPGSSPSAYVGGIAYSGAHGFQSTEPEYPPFVLLRANNPAGATRRTLHSRSHAVVAKESILEWDPDFLFLDLSTLQLPRDNNGMHELMNDPGYRTLAAVAKGNVYGVLPYNWCTKNYGSILADCFFIGKLLHPEAFADIDPVDKADEIYEFLVGSRMFSRMDQMFNGMAFSRIPLESGAQR